MPQTQTNGRGVHPTVKPFCFASQLLQCSVEFPPRPDRVFKAIRRQGVKMIKQVIRIESKSGTTFQTEEGNRLVILTDNISDSRAWRAGTIESPEAWRSR